MSIEWIGNRVEAGGTVEEARRAGSRPDDTATLVTNPRDRLETRQPT
jgi:hypothetical protein